MNRGIIIIIKLHERWFDRGRCRQNFQKVALSNVSFLNLRGLIKMSEQWLDYCLF
jgi:hypothetical protein